MPIDARLPRALAALAMAAGLAACATAPKPAPAPAPGPTPGAPTVPAPAPTPSAKYYKDDGPGENPPANLDTLPDAVPKAEPLHRFANRPYTVLGRDYVPATSLKPFRERGVASWYGRKFHGQKTSIGETYDMYAMTAAHPTLPLPSYARVTGLASGRSVVVRVNDRGPFLHGRVIDLSYAAAHRIGIAQKGSGDVEVEAILPADAPIVASAPAAVAPQPAAVPVPAPVESAPGGFVVQLGAFGNYANAQNFLAHVGNQLATAQVEARIRQSGGLWRVYTGPYPDRGEAQRAAQRIEAAFGFATAVAPH